MKLFMCSAFLLFSAFTVAAQEFITPFEGGIPPSMDAYVITTTGERVSGKIVFAISAFRGITRLTLITQEGEKKKFNAAELTELGFRNTGFVQAIAVIEQSESLKKISNTDWNQVLNKDYVVYNQALLPSGKKHVMMQTLNPGFDSKIRVFYSIGSRKTSGVGVPLPPGIQTGPFQSNSFKLTGGLPRAYWVSHNNSRVVKVKKGNYNKRRFKKIFGDCPEMVKGFDRPYHLSDFPERVFFYDQQCK